MMTRLRLFPRETVAEGVVVVRDEVGDDVPMTRRAHVPQVVAHAGPDARVRGGREDRGDDGPGGVPKEPAFVRPEPVPVPHEPALR